MKICITPSSLKLFGTYVSKQLPKLLQENKSATILMADLFDLSTDSFANTQLTEAENKEIVLQHMSIVPQMVVKYLSENPMVKYSDSNKFQELANEVITSSEAKSSKPFELLIKRFGSMLGNVETRIPQQNFLDRFEAVSKELFKTANQEAIYDEKLGYAENIQDPAKAFEFAVLRNIIRNNNSNLYQFKLTTLKDLKSNKDFIDTTGSTDELAPKLVLVDSKGEIVKFDKNGVENATGNFAAFNIKTDTKSLNYQKSVIAEQYEDKGMSKAEALKKAKADVNDFINYIKETSQSKTPIYLSINVGQSSLGFIAINRNQTTSLSDVANINTEEAPLSNEFTGKQFYPVIKPKNSNQTFEVFNKALSTLSDQEFEILHYLLTAEEVNMEGYKTNLNNTVRTKFISYFIQERPGVFSFVPGRKATAVKPAVESTVTLGNSVIKAKDLSIEQLKEWANQRFEKEFKKENVTEGTTIKKSIEEVTNLGELYYGKDGKIYESQGVRRSFANERSLSMDDFILGGSKVPVKLENGVIKVGNKKTLRQQITEVGYTHIVLNAEKKIVSMGSYLKFEKGVDVLSEVQPLSGEVKFRSISKRNQSTQATTEQNREALKWFRSNPLFDIIKLNFVDGVSELGPNFVANFVGNAINLYQGSSNSDIYHEAFHAFFDGILTSSERKEIYDSLRKRVGTFNTTVNGQLKTISWSSATELEIEEYLAEEFREFALSDGKTTRISNNKIKAFFQKLLNLLKSIFGEITYTEAKALNKTNAMVDVLFNSLYKGEFTSDMFVARNNEAKWKSEEIETTTGDVFSLEEMSLIMESMQSLLSQFTTQGLNISESIEDKQNAVKYLQLMAENIPGSELYNSAAKAYTNLSKNRLRTGSGAYMLQTNTNVLNLAINFIKARFEQELNSIKEKLKSIDSVSGESISLNYNKQLLEKVLNEENFGSLLETESYLNSDVNTTLLSTFLNNYSSLDLSEIATKLSIEEKELEEEDTENWEVLWGRGGQELMLDKTLSESTINILSSVRAYTQQGKGNPVLNPIGIQRILPFKNTLGKVARVLANTVDAQEMAAKLKAEAAKDKEIAQVFEMLGDITDLKHAKKLSVFEHKQWTSFWQSLNKSDVNLTEFLLENEIEIKLDEDAKTSVTAKVGKSQSEDLKIDRQWNANFQFKLLDEGNSYVDVVKGKPVINLLSVFEDWIDVEQGIYFGKISGEGPQTAKSKKQQGTGEYTRNRKVLAEADPIVFLSELGIELVEDPAVMELLYNETNNYDTPLMGYLIDNIKNRLNAVSWNELEGRWEKDNSKIYISNLNDLFKGYMYKNAAGEIKEQSEIFGVRKGLREIQFEYADEYTNFSARNAKGDLQSEKSFNSSLLLNVHAINKATSIEDLYTTPGLEHLNPEFNPQVLASNWLTSMFRLGPKFDTAIQGKRDNSVKLHVENLSGNKSIQKITYVQLDEYGDFKAIGSIENEKGESQISSDINTKSIGDFYLTLNGKQEIMRSEAKSTSLTVYADTKIEGESKPRRQFDLAVNKSEIEQIFSEGYKGSILFERFKGHIINDIIRVRQNSVLKKLIKNGDINGNDIAIDVKQLNRGGELFMFDAIFKKNSALRKELLTNYEIADNWNNNPVFSDKLIQKIEKALIKFFKEDAAAFESEFKNTIPLAQNMVDFYTTTEEETSKDVVTKMYRSFIVNNFLENANYSATFLGDASIYDIEKEAFHKRIAGFISTGKVIRRDSAWLQYINSEAFNNDAFSKKHNKAVGITRDYTFSGKLNTGVMKEIVSDAVFKEQYEKLGLDVTDYGKMEEADGQGWISFDAYRLLNISIDEWSDAQERVYQKMLNEESLTNEDLKVTFPVRKFQHYGSVINPQTQSILRDAGVDFAAMAFHKYSLMPLVPTVIGNSPKLVELHESMMEQGIAYVTMNSGSKLSTLTNVEYNKEQDKFVPIEDNFYSAEDRNVNMEMLDKDNPWTVNQIDVMNLKSQIFIKEGYKGYVTLPTQLRKIALVGILDNGIPFDFQPNAPKRKSNWEKLSDLKKRENSKKWAWYKDFTETLDEMEIVLKNNLLEDIQMKEVKNKDGSITYEGDSSKLVEYIKNQLKDKELLPEEINYISKPDGTLIDDLSFSLIGSKIEELLTTLVDKKLRRLKANGEKLTQVSSAMWESTNWKTGTKEAHEKYGTSGLKFHFAKDENGKYVEDPKTGNYVVTEMEIKISLQGEYKKLLNTELDGKQIKVFKLDLNGKRVLDTEASLKRLNEAIKNPVWLAQYGKMIDIPGVRIPSQGSNAFIATRVAEFLPESAGPIIIMPSEVVVNTGSDYDVDAMFTLMKNFISKYGRTEEIKYIPNQKEDPVVILTAIQRLQEQRSLLLEEKQIYRSEYIEYLEEKANVNEEVQEYIESIKTNKAAIKERFKKKKEIYNSKEYKISTKIKYHDILDQEISQGNEMIKNAEAEIEKILSNFFNERVSNKLERKAVVDANFKKFNDPIKEVESEIKEIENKLFQLEAKLQGRTTKGLENRLIDLIQSRVLDPSNMSRLVSPNTTEAWEDMARDAGSKIKKVFDKTIGGNTRVFQYRYNLLKQQEMSVSLDSLGIAAISSTFYAVFTTFQATLQGVSAKDQKIFVDALEFLSNESNKTNPRWAKSLEIIENYQSKTLKLESNTVNATNSLSLGMVENVNGQLISDLLSQLINGYVDAANSPWIAEMQGNKENTPTILFLTMAGVSPRNIISMMTNPLVLEYNSNLVKQKGIFGEVITAEDTDIIQELIEEFYGETSRKFTKPEVTALQEIVEKYKSVLKENGYNNFKLNSILNQATEFSEEELEEKINSDREIDFRDIELLAQFLSAKDMAESLNEFTQLTKFDTTKISSISEAQDRIEKIKEFKSIPASRKIIPNTFFEGIANSPIGKFNNDQFIVDLFSKYFGVKNNPALVLKSLGIQVPKGMDKRKVLTEFKDDFIWFLYQNAVYSLDTYTTSATAISNKEAVLPGKVYTLKESDVKEIEINDETGEVKYSKQAVVNQFGSLEYSPVMKYFNVNKPKDFIKFRIELKNLQEVSSKMEQEEFLETFGIFDNSSNSYFENGDVAGRNMILSKAALYNTMNPEAMFAFGSGVASILKNIYAKYSTELNNFAFFRDIKYDYNEALQKMNMYLPQVQDAQMAKVYRENISELKNSNHPEVREFFRKFDHIAIMQTGLTLKSKYALTKLIDQNLLENIIEEGIGIKYINNVLDDINNLVNNNVSREEIDGQIIDQFAAEFNSALNKKAQKVRGHNYTTNTLKFSKAKRVTLKRGKNLITVAKSFEEAQSIMRTEGGYIINANIILDAMAGENYSVEEVMKRSKGANLIIVNEKMLIPENVQPDFLTQEQLDNALKIIGIDNTGELPKLIAQRKEIGQGLSIEGSKVLKGLHAIKDEAMANRSNKVIAKSTEPLNPIYSSSTESYLNEIAKEESAERSIIADVSSRKKQFNSKDVVWIFGSGLFAKAYNNVEGGAEKYYTAIKNTFSSYHEKMIKKAIKEGVQTFMVGDATGIDALAKKYLEENGYVAVKQYTKGGIYYEMVKAENLNDVVVDLYKPSKSTVYVSNNSVFNEIIDSIYEVVLTNGVDQGVRKQPKEFSDLSISEKENIGYDIVQDLISKAINNPAMSKQGSVSFRSRFKYELQNISEGLLTLGKSNQSLFDTYVEQVLMDFRNQAQFKEVVQIKKQTIEQIYDSLGSKTISENVEIVDNIWANMKDKKIIKAYRANKANLLGAFKEYNSIGNPISAESKPAGQATKEFIGWLEGTMFTELEQPYRKALLDAFESGELKGMKIEYYKDIGMPSHATVLDYYINSKIDVNVVEGTASAVTNYNDIFKFGLLDESKKQTILDNFANKYKVVNALSYIEKAIESNKVSNEVIVEQLKKCY